MGNPCKSAKSAAKTFAEGKICVHLRSSVYNPFAADPQDSFGANISFVFNLHSFSKGRFVVLVANPFAAGKIFSILQSYPPLKHTAAF
jgi:hypothetical protein